VDDELAFHLEMKREKFVASGMSPGAADEASLRQFGNVDAVRNYCLTLDQDREQAMRRSNLLSEFVRDVAFAGRTLRRNAIFAAIVICTLAVGIGSNTAIFTLIDAVLLRRLPVPNPKELVAIGDPSRTSSLSIGTPQTGVFSYPLYHDVATRLHSFSGILASGRADRMKVRIEPANETPETLHLRLVSANYFDVLGVRPMAGRVFTGRDDQGFGTMPAVVISRGYWKTRFNDDATAIGRRITINGTTMTIIGVAQDGFQGEIVGQPTDMWIPLTMASTLRPSDGLLTDRGTSFLLLLGRRAAGVSPDQARLEVTGVVHDAIAAFPINGGTSESLRQTPVLIGDGSRGFSRLRATYSRPLTTLAAGVALLLLIICANVANLMLARGAARTREIGVRLAIGAGRGRLVRQLFTESLVIATVSAACGLLVAWWGSKLLLWLAATGDPLPLTVRLDVPVLAFTLAVSVVAVLVFGLLPAMRTSRVELATVLRGTASSATDSRRGPLRLAQLAIAAQVALSVVLLVGAGLLVRSVQHLSSTDVGLDRDHLIVVGVDAAGAGYKGDRLRSLVRDLSARAAALPGVTAVAYSENGLFSGTESATTLEVPGFRVKEPTDTLVRYDNVGPGYFRAIGAQLLRGRDFTASDDAPGAYVAVVNDRMANFFWNGDAVGKSFTMGDTLNIQVVGVVRSVTDHTLGADTVPRLYLEYLQGTGAPESLRLELRTAGDPHPVVAKVQPSLKAVSSSLTVSRAEALSDMMRESISEERLVARLATGFGILAMLLAGIGLYGVMNYAVTRRTREIGLRVALGAERGNVVTMILRDALRIVIVGLAIGIPAAFAATRLLRSQLHGVQPADPVAITGALTLLLLCAIAAALVPAIRASRRVAPLVALRQE
jgi:predicted permease